MKYIDLDKILKSSDSDFLKKIPRWMVKFLIRVIHQEDINQIIDKNSQYYGVEFIRKAFENFHITLKVEGLENLPENGKCFFVSNHPFGFIEGLTLTNIIAGRYGNVKAIGNDVYNMIPNLEPVIAVVNVFGKSPREYILALEAIYNSDAPIVHFPSGEVSRVYGGKIQDCAWQKSFISKAVSCRRNIVPVFFYGRNSRFFYFIGLMRRILGIKKNIELALLPHEMFRKRNTIIRLKVGTPIPWETFDKSNSHHAWAQWVREQVYRLHPGNASRWVSCF